MSCEQDAGIPRHFLRKDITSPRMVLVDGEIKYQIGPQERPELTRTKELMSQPAQKPKIEILPNTSRAAAD